MLVPTINVSGNLDTGDIYLTTGIQPPNDEGTTFEQTAVHAEMQSYASGGSIEHFQVVDSMGSNTKNSFIKSLFNNLPLRYISLTPILSICQSCGNKSIGKRTSCSVCESTDITVFSRPVGYYRPAVRGNLSQDLRKHDHRFWMSGRLEEFLRRKTFGADELDTYFKNMNEVLS